MFSGGHLNLFQGKANRAFQDGHQSHPDPRALLFLNGERDLVSSTQCPASEWREREDRVSAETIMARAAQYQTDFDAGYGVEGRGGAGVDVEAGLWNATAPPSRDLLHSIASTLI